MDGGSVLTGWYVGYVIGAAVAVVVVALVAVILSYARRIAVQVQALVDALVQVRADTAPLPSTGALNDKLTKVAGQLVTARSVLMGES